MAFPIFFETTEGQVQKANIASASDKALTIPIEGGAMQMPMDRIKLWRLEPPENWKTAEKEIKEGRPEKAIELMRPFVLTIIPLLSVPKGDAPEYFFKFVDLLRSRQEYAAALELLQRCPDDALSDVRVKTVILSAYCQTMLGNLEQAEIKLNMLRSPSRKSALFSLYRLTTARIAWAKKDLLTALDDVASVVALKRLGSDSYAEALYLSAELYDELGEAISSQKKLLAEDDRLRRLYEQDKGKAYETMGILTSEKSSVSAIMDNPPDLPGVSIEIRKQLVRVFPQSPWTTLAKAKLPEGVFDKAIVDNENQSGKKKKSLSPRKKEPNPSPTPDDGKLNTDVSGTESENF